MKMQPTLPPSPAAGPGAKPRGMLRPILLGLAGLLAAGIAAEAAQPGVTVDAPWVRFVMKGRPAAGYFTLRNDSDQDRTLVSASSPACASVMLHRSVLRSGLEKMVMVTDITVPPHGSLAFSPGSYHLMCMKPSPQVRPGKSIAVTLHFKDGGTAEAQFAVRGATGR